MPPEGKVTSSWPDCCLHSQTLDASQTEVNMALSGSSENSLLASSTCLFANAGGWWTSELASTGDWGMDRGWEEAEGRGGRDQAPLATSGHLHTRW